MSRLLLTFACLCSLTVTVAAAALQPLPLPSNGKEEAGKSAEAWLTTLDAGNYDETYEEAAEPLRKAVSRKKWRLTMADVRTPLGKAGTRQSKSAELTREIPGAPDAQYAIVEFTTSFANKPAVTESVTLVWGKDGKWRVTSYAVR